MKGYRDDLKHQKVRNKGSQLRRHYLEELHDLL